MTADGSGMAWEIVGQFGPHSDPDFAGHGWLWQIQRGERANLETRHVFVEISNRAFEASALPRNTVARNTARAIETQGRSEVERVAASNNPPRVVRCVTHGCSDIPPVG
jgi:hypothetical protein